MDKNNFGAQVAFASIFLLQVGFVLLHVASVGSISTWPWWRVAAPVLILFGLAFLKGVIVALSEYVSTRRALKRDIAALNRQRKWEREQSNPILAKRLH